MSYCEEHAPSQTGFEKVFQYIYPEADEIEEEID